MAANGISSLSTKEAKQHAKLDLASLKRQGYLLASNGTIISGPNTSANFYRTRNFYDITELPTQYVENATVDNPNPNLIQGRPWTLAPVSAEILMEDGTDVYQEDGSSLILTE